MQSCTSFVTGSFVFLVIPGCPVNSKPVRHVSCLQTDFPSRLGSRSFSSENCLLWVNLSDGTLAMFLKKAGDHVVVDEPIAQIETDKFSYVTSSEAGIIQKFVPAEGDTFEPGTKIPVISKSGEGVTHVAPLATNAEPAPSEKKADKQEHTTETPVLKKAPKEKPKAPPPPPSRPQPQNLNFLQRKGKKETNLIKLHSDYKDVFVEKHGVKLGLMSGFVKAAVSGLQNQPIINAVIDEDDDIIYRDYIDISIAIGTSKVSHLSK
ncbi:hypothetical protein LOK49_LG13G00266 [Camellia lanceoleosa]|uniref:Uncharacterized protein n=1 Tax=Camellia lanceoleosa TaxID=1840588 RepID=A0ACC0FGZ7_9ERIC|nr:hypothetical protein LOK49_LG13G00266 [Camellia lanceoleosa]